MDFRESPVHRAFRRKVRSWLAKHVPEAFRRPGYRGPASADERMAFTRQWQRQLYEGGWSGLSWPVEYGGQGAGIMELLIYAEEYALAGAPDLISLGVGISLTGPVLIQQGKSWQRERFLNKILTGEEIWCQGF